MDAIDDIKDLHTLLTAKCTLTFEIEVNIKNLPQALLSKEIISKQYNIVNNPEIIDYIKANNNLLITALKNKELIKNLVLQNALAELGPTISKIEKNLPDEEELETLKTISMLSDSEQLFFESAEATSILIESTQLALMESIQTKVLLSDYNITIQ